MPLAELVLETRIRSERTRPHFRAAETMIAFHHVTKLYPGGITALDCVDFQIEPGEFMLLYRPQQCR